MGYRHRTKRALALGALFAALAASDCGRYGPPLRAPAEGATGATGATTSDSVEDAQRKDANAQGSHEPDAAGNRSARTPTPHP